MLDLNLPSSSESAAAIWEKPALPGPADDSSTSDSSVINAGSLIDAPDEDSCSTRPWVGFNFVILKGDDGAQEETEEAGSTPHQQPRVVTWHLFPTAPVVPDAPQTSVVASCSSSSRPQRVDLTFSQANTPSSDLELANQHKAETRQIAKKSRRGPKSRSSQYRGVTFYRRTGRWESHIWDCGKQLYLGGFDTAEAAARAYDQAALKFRGVDADINFILSDYEDNLKQMNTFSKEEFVRVLRRQNIGPRYRGVTRKTSFGSEVHLGQLLGKKACHIAPKKHNGGDAFINFVPSNSGGELLYDSSTEDHHVDLNLRISQPFILGRKENQKPLGSLFDAFDTNKAKVKARKKTCDQSAYSSSAELAMFNSLLPHHQDSYAK